MGPHGLPMGEPWPAHGCAMELQQVPWNLKRIPWNAHGTEQNSMEFTKIPWNLTMLTKIF